MQLGQAVADPDLLEILDFLISNGVEKNSYIDDLLDWAGVYVNGEKRQLRFAALATVNKMPKDKCLSKKGIVKRAHRVKFQWLLSKPRSGMGVFPVGATDATRGSAAVLPCAMR